MDERELGIRDVQERPGARGVEHGGSAARDRSRGRQERRGPPRDRSGVGRAGARDRRLRYIDVGATVEVLHAVVPRRAHRPRRPRGRGGERDVLEDSARRERPRVHLVTGREPGAGVAVGRRDATKERRGVDRDHLRAVARVGREHGDDDVARDRARRRSAVRRRGEEVVREDAHCPRRLRERADRPRREIRERLDPVGVDLSPIEGLGVAEDQRRREREDRRRVRIGGADVDHPTVVRRDDVARQAADGEEVDPRRRRIDVHLVPRREIDDRDLAPGDLGDERVEVVGQERPVHARRDLSALRLGLRDRRDLRGKEPLADEPQEPHLQAHDGHVLRLLERLHRHVRRRLRAAREEGRRQRASGSDDGARDREGLSCPPSGTCKRRRHRDINLPAPAGPGGQAYTPSSRTSARPSGGHPETTGRGP